MHDTKATFQNRCSEIKFYIDFIKSVEPNKITICHSPTAAKTRKIEDKEFLEIDTNSPPILVDNETKKILKANVYLLLYNLVESTVRNTIEAIYAHLQTKGVSFHEVRDELRMEVLKNFKKHVGKNKIETFSAQVADITKDIIYLTFNPEDKFNGNVDARFIRAQVEKLGFQVVCDAVTRDGADLLSIKNQRNSLAHGNISFCDCGKDLVASELEEMADRTQKYLQAFIDCTDAYLTGNQYKKTA